MGSLLLLLLLMMMMMMIVSFASYCRILFFDIFFSNLMAIVNPIDTLLLFKFTYLLVGIDGVKSLCCHQSK